MKLTDYFKRPGADREKFAQAVGVTPEAVRLWERGERVPRPETMERIFTVSDGAVTPGDFYKAGGVDAPPPEAA